MRGFAAVHFTIQTDERTSAIWPDDANLGLWTRLLILAEQAWPEPAYLPRSVSSRRLRVLVESGCVELVDADRYRFHGLDAERQRRAEHGKKAADARWNAPSIPPSNADEMLTRAGASLPPPIPSPSPDRGTREDDPDYAVLLWLSQHGVGIPVGGGLHRNVIDLVTRHGATTVIATMEGLGDQPTAKQYIFGAANVLDAVPKPDVRAMTTKANEERERASHRRGVENTQRLIRELRGEVAS